MKNFVEYSIFILLQLLLPLTSFAQDVGGSTEDDGTNADGKVIIAETLVERCALKGSSEPEIPHDCIKKLTSDAKLGKTPEGEDYEDEAKKIVKEQTTGYMELAIKRLVDSSENEAKNDKITESSGDSREDVEQIIKLGTGIGEITADIIDTMSLRNIVANTESMYFNVVPSLASTMTLEEANDPELRKTKTITTGSTNE